MITTKAPGILISRAITPMIVFLSMVFSTIVLIACDTTPESATGRVDLRFDRTISRTVLESYLSRSITMMNLCTGIGDTNDNIRMLSDTGARFAGRTLYMWGSEKQLYAQLRGARDIATKIHDVLPEIILQGCVFEIVSRQVDFIFIPERVFEEFDLPVEARNFSYEAMLFDDGLFRDQWGKDSSVPDISRLETRMWIYYLATAYIETGMEAIHFGQEALMGRRDPGHRLWWDVLSRVRRFGAEHARRHIVLCDAHTPEGGLVMDGKLLFDFHSFPLRIKEIEGQPRNGTLEKGYLDSIYGRSKGGITPSGWRCESLPYLVELDNYGSSGKAGQPGMPYWTWGYDEIDWFAHQPEDYRSDWLRYASEWVRKTDLNGYIEIPGSRCLHDPIGKKNWYFANMTEHFAEGFNQEDTIKEIWKIGY